MSVMIQIRNVPDDVHRRLKSRASLAGKSLSDYLLEQVRIVTERPTVDELRERLSRLPPVTPNVSPERMVRDERDRR